MSCRIFPCVALVTALCISIFSSAASAAPISQAEPTLMAQAAVAPTLAVPSGSVGLRATSNGGANEQAIKQALASKTSLKMDDAPLKDIVNQLADKNHISIQFDNGALRDAKIDLAKCKVSINVKDVSLRSLLDLVLSDFNLTSVIKDEVLLITTFEDASTMQDTRLYNVRDLVARENDPFGGTDLDGLADAIQKTINPSSWERAGGTGTLAPFNNNGVSAFIIVQTPDGHEQIENLLAELRKLRPQRGIRQ